MVQRCLPRPWFHLKYSVVTFKLLKMSQVFAHKTTLALRWSAFVCRKRGLLQRQRFWNHALRNPGRWQSSSRLRPRWEFCSSQSIELQLTNANDDFVNWISFYHVHALNFPRLLEQLSLGYEYQCSSITRMCVLQTYAVALQHETKGCGVGPNGLIETQRKLFQQSWKGQCMNMVKRNSI